MDSNAEHIVKVIDATAREAGLDNEQKAVNHSLRALQGMGAIPERKPGQPWYAVSVTSDRQWDTAQGDMPVAIRAETGESEVDTAVNKEVILCGDRIGYWRVPLVNGKADVKIPLNQYEPSGSALLVVVDAEDPQRQGSTGISWH